MTTSTTLVSEAGRLNRKRWADLADSSNESLAAIKENWVPVRVEDSTDRERHRDFAPVPLTVDDSYCKTASQDYTLAGCFNSRCSTQLPEPKDLDVQMSGIPASQSPDSSAPLAQGFPPARPFGSGPTPISISASLEAGKSSSSSNSSVAPLWVPTTTRQPLSWRPSAEATPFMPFGSTVGGSSEQGSTVGGSSEQATVEEQAKNDEQPSTAPQSGPSRRRTGRKRASGAVAGDGKRPRSSPSVDMDWRSSGALTAAMTSAASNAADTQQASTGGVTSAAAASSPAADSNHPPIPEATEEDWARRQMKRRNAVASTKDSHEYKVYLETRLEDDLPEEPEIPGTPDSEDRTVSKRKWEEEVRIWRAALKKLADIEEEQNHDN